MYYSTTCDSSLFYFLPGIYPVPQRNHNHLRLESEAYPIVPELPPCDWLVDTYRLTALLSSKKKSAPPQKESSCLSRPLWSFLSVAQSCLPLSLVVGTCLFLSMT